MGWLRSLLAQGEKITRLSAECNFHMANTAELTTKLEASEARLIREIDSNRTREDAYKDQIVALCTPMPGVPFRDHLGDAGTIRELPGAIDVADEKADDLEFEAQVTQRAAEYAENAIASRGIAYSPEDLEILKEKIRQNPSDYLDN